MKGKRQRASEEYREKGITEPNKKKNKNKKTKTKKTKTKTKQKQQI